MSGFPALQHALTLQIILDHPLAVGASYNQKASLFLLQLRAACLTDGKSGNVGNVSRGAPLQVIVRITPVPVFYTITFKGGSLKSEPGFSPTIDAEFVFGVDFFRADPSQKHVRLDVKSLLK
ncbi:hypothetical protein FGG08_006719 [Glutinoglossum americanum]|uniref:Uncharacterized protein n=1 Tax=Glutinoglossum americanum TaxID=1670608 RepID=A0A9P8I4R6_9PEZI|nr:hypothetical protein FGG08_006719 [Glutinoglossum americanum]